MAGGIDGLDRLMRKFGDLGTLVAEQTMIKAVGASAKLVQAEARSGCR